MPKHRNWYKINAWRVVVTVEGRLQDVARFSSHADAKAAAEACRGRVVPIWQM